MTDPADRSDPEREYDVMQVHFTTDQYRQRAEAMRAWLEGHRQELDAAPCAPSS